MGVYSGKLSLTNPSGVPLALSNDFDDIFNLKEIVSWCKNPQELEANVNDYTRYNNFMVVEDNPKYTRLLRTSVSGNKTYLLAYKEQSSLGGFSDEELIAELESRGYQIT